MRRFLDTLLQAVAGRPETRGIDESERLRIEVVRLHEEGRYREAEDSARRLVEIEKETGGVHHPGYATALGNLALLRQRQGDLASAEELLRQVLAIRREVLGERHADTASAMNNLALLLCERGALDEAESLMRQAMVIRGEVLGAHHPDTATGLTSLALLLCKRGDLDDAEPLLRQALEVRRGALGERHPDTATAMNNLGLLLRERGGLDGAEALLERALELRTEVLGEHHPDTRSTAEILAILRERHSDTVASGRTVHAARHKPEASRRPAGDERLETPRSEPAPVSVPPRDSHALRLALESLRDAFTKASEGLLEEASRMQSPGSPPDVVVLSEASRCHDDFSTLRLETLRLAESLGEIRHGAEGHIASLDDLGSFLDALGEAEREHARRDEARKIILDRLTRVLSLSVPEGDEALSTLVACQDWARDLETAIARSGGLELPAEVEPVSRGDHPLAALLGMVHEHAGLTDDDWSRHFAAVEGRWGRPLAVAAARKRIVAPPAGETPIGLRVPSPLR